MKSANKQHNILIFSNQGLSALHLGFELEILEKLTKEHKNIISITCNNILSSCYFNPSHNIIACSICEARTMKAHQHYPNIKHAALKQYNFEYATPKATSLEDLIALNYENINIGRGIASSLVSTFREYDLLRIKNIDKLIAIQAKMAINTILNFKAFIKKYKPDEIYLFNGRFTEVYVITQLCETLKINFKTFETGSDRGKYMLKENTTVHNIQSFIDDLNEFKNTLSKEKIEAEGKKIFEDRIKGNQGDLFNFLSLQSEGKLPENFDTTKNNIAIFNSSEDEMKVIKGWDVALYKNQNDAIREIAMHYKDDDNTRIYLRIHPNLVGLENSQTQELKNLRINNLTVIPSSSPIDTYELIRACDKTVSFGSSAGIEASYLKKPSILLGNSFYKGLKCLYEPENYTDLFTLIDDENLPAITHPNMYLYMYTLFNRGKKVAHFVYKSKNKASFKGKGIKQFEAGTFYQFFSFIKSYKDWKEMTQLVYKQKLSFSNALKLHSHFRDTTHNKSK